jgi:uncharacterized phiE125 gp8 family phage protein
MINVITPPAVEPVTLTEMKAHLRVDISNEDALISGLISAAREQAEETLRRSLGAQTLELVLTTWPSRSVELLRGPVRSIVSVEYTDIDGEEGEIDEGDYYLAAGGNLVLAALASWPVVTIRELRIRYEAGYATPAQIPVRYRQAIKMLVGDWYEHRESTLIDRGVAAHEMPHGVMRLLRPDRGYRF